MWDLKVIRALNEVAVELAEKGKNPAHAMSELVRRSKERKANRQPAQSEGDSKEK